MIGATSPRFPLHFEPTHTCTGCQQLDSAHKPGQQKHLYCRLHITPFAKCIHYDTGDHQSILTRLGGAPTCR